MKKTSKKAASVICSLALVSACGVIAGCSNDSGASAEAAAAQENAQVESPEGQTVTVDWLHENLSGVCVVDARDASSYKAGHIPGAVNLHWTSVSNQTAKQGQKGWAELSSAEDIAAAAAAAGITTDKPIVVYTNIHSGWGEDGRIMWELKEAGASDVHVLDGGWTKWNGAGYETEAGMVADDDQDAVKQVGISYVKKHLKDAKIVDARAADEYNGKLSMGEARMGHIPGAVSVPYVSLFAKDGTRLSDDELQQIFDDAGLSVDDSIIVYCTGGVRAAAVAEILSDKGFAHVSVYTAGFSEWAGNSANKVEK